jgi:hypothetical protein
MASTKFKTVACQARTINLYKNTRSELFKCCPNICFNRKVVFDWYIILFSYILTLSPLTWKIWWTPNNASRWQMGFNWTFKGLNLKILDKKKKQLAVSQVTSYTMHLTMLFIFPFFEQCDVLPLIPYRLYTKAFGQHCSWNPFNYHMNALTATSNCLCGSVDKSVQNVINVGRYYAHAEGRGEGAEGNLCILWFSVSICCTFMCARYMILDTRAFGTRIWLARRPQNTVNIRRISILLSDTNLQPRS